MAFRVKCQQASGGVYRAMVLNGGENVTQFAGFRRGITDPISGEQRQIERTGNFYCRAVSQFLLATKMPLQFNINIGASKNMDQAFDCIACCIYPTAFEGERKWPAIPACKADEPCRMFLKFIFENCAIIFGCAQLHLCDQSAQVLITDARGDKKWQAKRIADFRFQIADFAMCC